MLRVKSIDKQLEQAIYNNAVWCDTVCRTHGSAGEFLTGIWINRQETPPFYPNAVTLAKDQELTLGYIHTLLGMGLRGEWGIKDSYCTLDLTSNGFRSLFEAEWIYRRALQPKPASNISGIQWLRVTEAFELAKWETAWRGEPVDEVGINQARIFLPSLLVDKNIAVIAAYQDQQIVAGVIASCTEEVVGISNIFVPAYEEERFRAGCIAKVIDAFPGRSLVGYEAGRDLAEMQAQDFEILGPLKIWVKAIISE